MSKMADTIPDTEDEDLLNLFIHETVRVKKKRNRKGLSDLFGNHGEKDADEKNNNSRVPASRTALKNRPRRKKRGLSSAPRPSSKIKKEYSLSTEDDESGELGYKKQHWERLDIGKKKRRLMSYLDKHEDLKRELTETALKAMPVWINPNDIENYDDMLIYTTNENYTIEIADENTTLEEQLGILTILEPESDLLYYKSHISQKEHVNLASEGEEIGPVIISVVKEIRRSDGSKQAFTRVIIRTISNDRWLFIPATEKTSNAIREIKQADHRLQDLSFKKLSGVEDELLNFEEMFQKRNNLRVGVLYRKSDQFEEDEMYSNGNKIILLFQLTCSGNK
eukprot:TRINITY_DN2765_c1_g2_i2.p1 TRINITY_DN2765_c1_g2~~TRINITY_DN2765_c1_g2_i2.p1  ORF type:complete len:372 (-),score=82.80 TRINITY_DN2765_c1_g2_i2:581-1591(-)